MIYIISIYFNKYTFHVLCTYFNLYDCPEWNKTIIIIINIIKRKTCVNYIVILFI